MEASMTLIQAQMRYIERSMSCHTGHVRRVRRSAAKELKAWAVKHGYDPDVVHRDAKDMLELELSSED